MFNHGERWDWPQNLKFQIEKVFDGTWVQGHHSFGDIHQESGRKSEEMTIENLIRAIPPPLVPFGTFKGPWRPVEEELYWLTEGAPESWRVVVWDGDPDTCEVFDCDMTDFLAGLATGEILPMHFPDDLLPCDRLFKPDSAERDVRDEDLSD